MKNVVIFSLIMIPMIVAMTGCPNPSVPVNRTIQTDSNIYAVSDDGVTYSRVTMTTSNLDSIIDGNYSLILISGDNSIFNYTFGQGINTISLDVLTDGVPGPAPVGIYKVIYTHNSTGYIVESNEFTVAEVS